MIILALFLSLAPGVRAAEAPSVFEAHYADSIERSLSADSFFASKLALSFDGHMAAVAQLSDVKAAAAYLKWQVAGPARAQAPRETAARLEAASLGEHESGALLAAGALAAPTQFNRVASRLEELKPGLGRRLIRSVHGAAQEARFPPMMRALQQIAGSLKLESSASAYDSRGKAVAFFDGGNSR